MGQFGSKIILFCVFSFILLTAQANSNKDTPIELGVQKHHLVNTYLKKLIYFDSIKNSDSLSFYLHLAEEECNRIKLSKTEKSDLHNSVGHIYNFAGLEYYQKNKLFEALIAYKKANEIFYLLNNKVEIATTLNNIAIIYLNIGNYNKTLDCLYKSTALFIDIKDSIGIVQGYNSIAKIYRDQGDLQRTQKYLDNALKVARKLDHNGLLSSVLNSMAGVKKDLGDLKSALDLYIEALTISKNGTDLMKVALILNNLGVIHKEMNELEYAKVYFEEAFNLSIKNNSNSGKAFTLVNLADYYYLIANYQKALELAKEAYDISEHTGNRECIFKAINLLIKISEEQNDWKNTAYYQKQLIKLNEKREKEIIGQISNQETVRFELEKDKIISKNKEAEEQLNREKELQRLYFFYIIFALIFIVLIAFSMIIYSRLRSSRELNKDITRQSEERKLLLQEVHHRVKNNFQIVSSMLRLQSYNFKDEVLRQNFEEAVNRINAMAIVHDVIYRQEKFKDIDSKTYLEKLVKNLHRSGDSRILISIDSEEIPFKIETLINLGIALNELITNSFKHAFNENVPEPKIVIELRAVGVKTYELVYKDNGVGFKPEDYTSSFGMELIETIISNFDGKVKFSPEPNWKTLLKISFKEE